MRNRKFVKPLLIVVAMILVCIMSVFATLAYLQNTSEVAHNTFTVGNVQITLDETDVDVYGEKESDTRVLANEYKLIPNRTYTKDPTVTVNAGSEESYVRMIVEISDIADVKTVFANVPGAIVDNKFLPQYFVNGWDNGVWVTTGIITEIGDKAYYEFRYNTTVDTLDGNDEELPALFETFTVPAGIENAALASLEEMEIKVVAQAVQADGFDTADAAFTAIGTDYAAFFPVA